MPATKNTFLIFPFRFGPGITARAKSKLVAPVPKDESRLFCPLFYCFEIIRKFRIVIVAEHPADRVESRMRLRFVCERRRNLAKYQGAQNIVRALNLARVPRRH